MANAPIQLKKVTVGDVAAVPTGYVGFVAGSDGKFYAKDGSSAAVKLATSSDVDAAVFTEQSAEGVGLTLNSIDVFSAGFPPWKTIMQSITNADSPLNSYNHIVALGFNTSVESFHGNTIPGKPTVILGFESNFKDNIGEYGPEVYFEFANLQRPFYARQIFDPATTTIASGSNGASLPQATINVASTTNFPQYGWIFVNGQRIAYTGKTATTFTGCTGGAGTLATGQAVESEFRDNANVQIDIGTDGYGAFSIFAGKLNPALISLNKDQFNLRVASVYFSGTLVIDNIIKNNGSAFSPARRFYSEDFAGDATITIQAAFVDVFRARITTSGTPVFAAPTNPTTGQELTIILSNRFGGTTISGPTWDSVFKLNTTWTNPSPATSRSITFVYDGTNWIEISRTAANVPN